MDSIITHHRLNMKTKSIYQTHTKDLRYLKNFEKIVKQYSNSTILLFKTRSLTPYSRYLSFYQHGKTLIRWVYIFYLQNDIRDKLTPIQVELTYRLVEPEMTPTNRLLPMLDQTKEHRVIKQVLRNHNDLRFFIECKLVFSIQKCLLF